MKNNNTYDPKEADELSRRIDALTGRDDDLAEYTPAGMDIDDGRVFQNFSNNYGGKQSAPAEYADYGGSSAPSRAELASGKKVRKRRGCGCATGLLMLLALVLGSLLLVGSFFRMPLSEDSLGSRKEKTATVLLCGTDKDGTRTDTMMLLYLDGAENRIGLLSLPRDTYTITDEGKRAKLNSAYGRNGCGEKGMEWTMTYVQRTIGYRPDGYILVDMDLVPQIVDLMGGLDFHMEQDIWVRDVNTGEVLHVPEGDRHLNGEEVLATLRYRSGYADADLGRIRVQRKVISECMKQWVRPSKLVLLPQALDLIQEESLTDLSVNNFLWIGKTILTSMGDMTSDTLPGYADMRGSASYYILRPEEVAELINESYNPYNVVIDVDDLDIAE